MSDQLAVGVDVGGTKIAAGLVAADGTVLKECRRETPGSSPEQVVATIAEVVAELGAGQQVAAVGVGAAGFVDAEQATVLFAPNLAWRDEPLKERVQRAVGLPVVVENDANAAAWAEARFGAGVGEPQLALVTVGTGIGGGIVTDGRLHRGRWGVAAEFGHLRLVPEGRRCGCGQRGCWEQYCSGRALLREAREIADVQPDRAARLLELGGGRPEGITARQVTAAAAAGDPAALECLTIVGRALGAGLVALSAVLDPGTYVVGGGVGEVGELLLQPAREVLEQSLPGRGYRPVPRVVPARLGNRAGLVGAADLARSRA